MHCAAARAAGEAAAARYCGFKRAPVPLATSKQPQVYCVFRSGSGASQRPALRFGCWADCKRVTGATTTAAAQVTFSGNAVFQGFPSATEADEFESAFWRFVDDHLDFVKPESV